MNWDQIEGNWEKMKGKVKTMWGKLTDDDMLTIQGKRQQLVGKLQERYGFMKDKAEGEIDRFLGDCNCDSTIDSSSNGNYTSNKKDSTSVHH